MLQSSDICAYQPEAYDKLHCSYPTEICFTVRWLIIPIFSLKTPLFCENYFALNILLENDTVIV